MPNLRETIEPMGLKSINLKGRSEKIGLKGRIVNLDCSYTLEPSCKMKANPMPKLVSLYIRNVVFGFALSGLFVTALMYFNVANLWHLVNASSMGWVAALMLFVFNGIVFAGVQFAIAIMRLDEDDDEPKGGKRGALIVECQPIAIPVEEHRPRR